MTIEEFVLFVIILLVLISVPGYYIYRIAKNDWVINLKRWNLLAQFRQGRHDNNSEEDF